MALELVNPFAGDLSSILITFIVPFFIFFTVLLIGLKMSGVFGSHNSIYVILALGLTIMIYGGKPETFQFLASYLVQMGITGSIVALGGIFIIIFFALIRRGYRVAQSIGLNDEQKLKELDKEEKRLLDKYKSSGFFGVGGSSSGERTSIRDKLKEIEFQRNLIRSKKR